jgi:hypothetical protein
MTVFKDSCILCYSLMEGCIDTLVGFDSGARSVDSDMNHNLAINVTICSVNHHLRTPTRQQAMVPLVCLSIVEASDVWLRPSERSGLHAWNPRVHGALLLLLWCLLLLLNHMLPPSWDHTSLRCCSRVLHSCIRACLVLLLCRWRHYICRTR